MPRPARPGHVLPSVAVALGCAALGPGILHAALAAAAGSLFEAAPFVLAAELVPRRLRFLAQLAGCGCAGRVPGALSLAATALCWIAFGPAIALARFGAGLALVRFASRCHGDPGASDAAPHDAFDELIVLAPCAAVSALAASALVPLAPHLMAAPFGPIIAFGLGLALGSVAPCATAAVAIAAALGPHLAPATAGLLVTGGLVRSTRRARFLVRRPAATPAAAIVSRLALAVALALLVQRGASGFVNPRLLPLVALGAGLALLGACRASFPRRTLERSAGRMRDVIECREVVRPWPDGRILVPTLLFVALATGSPVPHEIASATQLADAYPGERLSFIGTVARSGSTSVLQRYEITCCRADATPIVVRLASRLPLPDGAWVAARGMPASSKRGLVLRLNRWRAATPPADPFVYR